MSTTELTDLGAAPDGVASARADGAEGRAPGAPYRQLYDHEPRDRRDSDVVSSDQTGATSASTDGLTATRAGDGARSALEKEIHPAAGAAGDEEDLDIFAPGNARARAGYLAQYLAVGIIYAGLPATCYGFFLGYLNVPGYLYSTVLVVTSLPWSFKFAFGMLNDTVPILGLRRKPYMVAGWAFCAAMLVVLGAQTLPEPYWCVGEDGAYVKEVHGPDGARHAAEPCNADAAKSGGHYAALMFFAATGYVLADVAADGLTVEYARAEPEDRRGRTQTTAYLTRAIGQAIAATVVGLGMNSKLYNGSFDWGLSFPAVCRIFAVPSVIMVPVSALLVREVPRPAALSLSARAYGRLCWQLLRSGAFFSVVLFSFLTPAVGNVTTTAAGLVKSQWAGVKSLQNQIFSLAGHLLFAGGLYVVRRNYLQASWRAMLATTTVFLNLLDGFFITLTIFDVVRNQYFYLGETVLYEVPAAAQFVVSTYVIVEMAEDGNEGMVYGLLTTAHNLGTPLARAIGNQIYGLFEPSLSEEANYIEDTPAFRMTVFYSFVLSFVFGVGSLAFLPLLPDQKTGAQSRKRSWPRRQWFARATVGLLGTALLYSLIVNGLSMHRDTMCLRFAGGSGCDHDVEPSGSANATANATGDGLGLPEGNATGNITAVLY